MSIDFVSVFDSVDYHVMSSLLNFYHVQDNFAQTAKLIMLTIVTQVDLTVSADDNLCRPVLRKDRVTVEDDLCFASSAGEGNSKIRLLHFAAKTLKKCNSVFTKPLKPRSIRPFHIMIQRERNELEKFMTGVNREPNRKRWKCRDACKKRGFTEMML